MSKKIKLLIVGEFSQLSTGFSTYFGHLLPRLHKTGLFEIAELALYCNKDHPAIDNVPWKVYPNEPDPSKPEEMQQYQSGTNNQFGAWKFESVLLDFTPDICGSISDPWMSSFINRSPFRQHFKYIHMPTCDGQMQKWEWLEDYKQCDLLLTYTDWAKHTLERQSGNKLKVFSSAPSGADLDLFTYAPKKQAKQKLGLEDNIFLIQSVMRNQPRKLFPEILRMFRKFLELCEANKNIELAKKAYLYWHTSFPDVGWNIPEELRLHGLSHKVLFTYMCANCKAVYPQFWMGDVCQCRNCRQMSCHLPNTANGVTRDVLANIHQAADIYVQYSTSEGLGMPQIDALSTGTPIMSVESSGMIDCLYYGGGIPIKIHKINQEPINQTNQLRALPDNNDTAQNLYEFLTLSEEEKEKYNLAARKGAETHFNWDRIAKIWQDAILSINYPDQKTTWFGPPKLVQPLVQIPDGLNNEQFIEWCFRYILNKPHEIFGEMAQRGIAGLNLGYEIIYNQAGIPVRNPIDRNAVVQNLLKQVQDRNNMEQYRFNHLCLPKPDVSKLIGYVEC